MGEIYTDNVALAPSGMEDDDLITEITPGFSLLRETSRLRLDVDYQMQSLFFVDDSDANRINHGLDGKMTAELEEDFLFLDARAYMSQAIVDARSSRPSNTITGSNNLTDVQAYSISPYIRHDFSGYASTLLRYGYETVDTDGAVQTSETNYVSAELKSGRHFGLLSWGMNFYKSEQDRGRSSDLNEERATASLAYRIHPKFSLLGEAGREDNEFESSEVAQNGSYWGAGAKWAPNRYLSLTALEGSDFTSGTVLLTPSVRTSLNVSYRERDVGLNPGSVWTGAFRHFTRRSTWQLNYFEDTQTTQRLISSQDQLLDTLSQFSGTEVTEEDLTSVIDLIDQFPPEIQAQVENALFQASLGLKEEVFERKRARGSVSYRTGKSVFTLMLFKEQRNFLDPLASALQSDILEDQDSRGALAQWQWKFSGRSRTTLRSHWEHTEFSSDGREDDLWYLDAMLTRDLSRRASGSLAYRHTRNDSTSSNDEYEENRLTARLTMEF